MLTAIVTGCSRETGFGQLTAKTLAKAGFQTYATLRRAERAEDLKVWAGEQGVDLTALEHDVTDPAQNRSVADAVCARSGRIDLLVNNVGMSSFGALETLHDRHIRDVMETNFFSAIDMTRAVLPAMRAQGGGRILFVTSIAGMTGVPGETIYCASKFALEGLAEALAMEVARFGIQVSTIRPAFFNTGMSAHNTDAVSFYERNPAYDAFNECVVGSTSQGELDGEDPQIVADTVLEAATTAEPRLRWQPGQSAPEIVAVRRTLKDEEWRDFVMAELGLEDWLVPQSQEQVA